MQTPAPLRLLPLACLLLTACSTQPSIPTAGTPPPDTAPLPPERVMPTPPDTPMSLPPGPPPIIFVVPDPTPYEEETVVPEDLLPEMKIDQRDTTGEADFH